MASEYNRKDHYYERAKTEGYRSRAAFKLLELNKKYHFLKRGLKVVDLGAWPGGWVQVAAQIVGSHGLVVGVDLVTLESFPQNQVQLYTGDVRDEETLEWIKGTLRGEAHVVLSDMSPKLSGIPEVDHAASAGCAELAFWVSQQILEEGGTLVVKLFKSNDAEKFISQVRKSFSKVTRVRLDSTRKTSNEMYFVGVGFKRMEQTV